MLIMFFGDSNRLYGDDPVFYFSSAGVVCDFSECGNYIAWKHRMRGYKYSIIRLGELINLLAEKYALDEIRVEAHNNGIAWFFRRNGIKTMKDLQKAINNSHKAIQTYCLTSH